MADAAWSLVTTIIRPTICAGGRSASRTRNSSEKLHTGYLYLHPSRRTAGWSAGTALLPPSTTSTSSVGPPGARGRPRLRGARPCCSKRRRSAPARDSSSSPHPTADRDHRIDGRGGTDDVGVSRSQPAELRDRSPYRLGNHLPVGTEPPTRRSGVRRRSRLASRTTSCEEARDTAPLPFSSFVNMTAAATSDPGDPGRVCASGTLDSTLWYAVRCRGFRRRSRSTPRAAKSITW